MSRHLFISAALTALCLGEIQAHEWIPKGAKVCYRSQQEDGFLPDATFCLKLKITKPQFEKIVKTVGATPHTETRRYTDDKGWLNWSPAQGASDPFAASKGQNVKPPKGESVWDPKPDLTSTFVRQNGDYWEYLKYENGYLYYKSLNH